VNTEPGLRLFLNKPDRSNPDDIEDMNSKALKNFGDADDFVLGFSGSVVFSYNSFSSEMDSSN